MIDMKHNIPAKLFTAVDNSFDDRDETISLERRTNESESVLNLLNRERIREIRLKYWGRLGFALFFVGLLSYQNYEVFTLVRNAFETNKLKDLEIIFSTLIGATLTETYLVIRVIVDFMFKDNDYSFKK
jgi:hypothetical protein